MPPPDAAQSAQSPPPGAPTAPAHPSRLYCVNEPAASPRPSAADSNTPCAQTNEIHPYPPFLLHRSDEQLPRPSSHDFVSSAVPSAVGSASADRLSDSPHPIPTQGYLNRLAGPSNRAPEGDTPRRTRRVRTNCLQLAAAGGAI